MQKLVKIVSKAFRNHLHFIIIVPLLIIVMTWPTSVNIFDVKALRWPTSSGDIFMKFWDAWYGKLMLAGQADFFRTDLLFYPNGLSLAYHNFSLPNMIVFGGLQEVLPTTNAFMLTFLLTLLANVISAYVALCYLFRNKWAALAGAVLFGINPYMLVHPQHSEVITVATLPLSLYAFHRGVVGKRMKWMVVAGALCGISAFIGMYVFVCLLLTMVIYSLHLALKFWREPQFWKSLILLLAVAGAISMIRIYPMIADTQKLDAALNKSGAFERSSDVLVYFVNGRHPLAPLVLSLLFGGSPPAAPSDGYLGLVPLLIIGLGFLRPGYRRKMILWFAVALFFALLRLGSVLKIGGVTFADILLPKHYLEDLFPWIFGAFWDTTFFHIGLLFPFAILVCYSLKILLGSMSPRRQAAVSLVVVILVAFEYYQPPLWTFSSESSQHKWIDWLGTEESQDSIRVVNLPMGRIPSKYYGFYQTLNGYPHAEGLAARTPNESYRYIDSNLLLNTWRLRRSVHCLPTNQAEYDSSLDQLAGEGFTHIIRHRLLPGAVRISHGFASVPASYEDGHVSIYRFENMRDSCKNAALHGKDAMAHLTGLVLSAPVRPDPAIPVLSIHPSRAIADEVFRLYGDLLSSWRSFFHIYQHDSEVQFQSSDPWYTDLEHISSRNNFILLTYDPSQTDPQAGSGNGETDLRHFKPCQRVMETADTIAEFFVKSDFPCDLVTSDNPFQVRYDNNIQLANFLHKMDEEYIDLYFWWKNRPLDTPAISLQIFAEHGAKFAQQDFTVGHEPLAQHRLDLSSLTPGDYVAKLILYNYDTGVSVPGTVTSSQTHFDRELEIARITIE